VTIGERIKILEGLASESAEKRKQDIKGLEDARVQLNSVQGTLAAEKTARNKYHTVIEERLANIEDQIIESGSKHAETWRGLDKSCQEIRIGLSKVQERFTGEKHLNEKLHSELTVRLELVEQLVGEYGEKHMQHICDMETHAQKMREITGYMSGEASQREKEFSRMANRLASVERDLVCGQQQPSTPPTPRARTTPCAQEEPAFSMQTPVKVITPRETYSSIPCARPSIVREKVQYFQLRQQTPASKPAEEARTSPLPGSAHCFIMGQRHATDVPLWSFGHKPGSSNDAVTKP